MDVLISDRDQEDTFTKKSFWSLFSETCLCLGPKVNPGASETSTISRTALTTAAFSSQRARVSSPGAPERPPPQGKGSCQVAYLSLGVCELQEMADREGKPAVDAVP